MLEHGGRLRHAARAYGRPLEDWLDLSTGLAPWSWPLPQVPVQVWQRLPEDDDGLSEAAQAYYQAVAALPVAGSQAAIQLLPRMRPASRVGLMSPAYAEHRAAWLREGHQLIPVEDIDAQLDCLDVLLLINPNNPTGQRHDPERLLDWHRRLQARGGWLVLDEAFIDSTPGQSLARFSQRPGLIVLRSVGKFFGLAGVRCGFVLAEPTFLQRLHEQLGPWSVNGPARWLVRQALADRQWQAAQRLRLQQAGRRLEQLLRCAGLVPSGGCELFQWWCDPRATELHRQLAEQGIWTRCFEQPVSLRFGLPGREADWQRLAEALGKVVGRNRWTTDEAGVDTWRP